MWCVENWGFPWRLSPQWERLREDGVFVKRREFVCQAGLGTIALAVACRAPVRGALDSGGATDTQNPPRSMVDAGQNRPIEDGGNPREVDGGGTRCSRTEPDIEGPYYREGIPVRSNLNIHGDVGEPLTFAGTVTDLACVPIANAVVELWQANPQGDYDTSSSEKRYYGQVATDAEGAFSFTTLMPGRYLNGPTYRPAHLHLKVWVGNERKLTTQIYFDDDPYNESDAWYDAARSVAVNQGLATYRFTV